MLRTITTTIFGFAAAAFILAPIAAADDNPDMTSGNKVTPGSVTSSTPVLLEGSGNGTYPAAWMEDCKIVLGTWTDQGFVRDPNGKDTVWTKYGDGLLYSSPFDDGLSKSSRNALNRVREKKAADQKLAAAEPAQ